MKKIAENLKIKAKKLLGVAAWILTVLLLISTVRNINRVISIRNDVEKEKEIVEKMKADNAQLEAQIAQTQGSEFIEKQIRDKLGLAKPGEAIVVLPDPAILRAMAPQTPVEEDTLPDPNWVRWEKLFF
jgi:cell division protein FtsB